MLENIKPTPEIKAQITRLNNQAARLAANNPVNKAIKVKAIGDQIWNRAWGGLGGVAVNVNFAKIAREIKSQNYYNKLATNVTPQNLESYINQKMKNSHWSSGRVDANVFRSKQIIRSLYQS